MFPELAGRRAVVTGGAAGIGAAVAARLVDGGARVALADADEVSARRTAAGLGAAAMAVTCDVTSGEAVRHGVAQVAEAFGGIDILVNNAGVIGPVCPLVDYPEEDFARVVDVDLLGAYRVTRAVLPHMLPGGWGRVVNVASISGKAGNPGMTAYAAAKAGLIGLTKALAAELAATGVLVNAVTPGGVGGTRIAGQVEPELARRMAQAHPLGRLARPEEVAAMVAWLCSGEVSFSTGAVFDISGGRAMY